MAALLTFAFILTALAVNASPIDYDDFETILPSERALYPQFITMPDGEGNPHQVDLHEPVNYQLISGNTRDRDRNVYLLYTRQNPNTPQIISTNDEESVINSNFDPSKQTIIIAHGWLSKGNSEPNPTVTAVYLSKDDVNVINVDWNYLAMSNYVSAAYGVPAVGRAVGKLINWLHSSFGLDYSNVHLVGFSLGAHLVGNAGRETGGKVARVTGLDPAGPLFNLRSDRLQPTDGVYVEAIHTDGGYTVGGLGIGSAIAQVDFFPNGGVSQPGCWTNVCNHARAWELFAVTVTYNHLEGRRCRNGIQMTLNTCRGDALKMGNGDLRKTGTSGSYRVDTGRRYPF